MGLGAVAAVWAVSWMGLSAELTPRLDESAWGRFRLNELLIQAHAEPGASLRGRPSRAGRGFSLGYLLSSPTTELALRAGYRFGLPLDEPAVELNDQWVLTSGGTFRVSAGTVTWLQVDLEAFRELAGTRVLRVDAVPGIRLSLSKRHGVDAIVGVLISTRATGSRVVNRVAGVLNLGGRF